MLWHTEGKGDEDLGVHFFDRRAADHDSDLRGPATLSVPLPNSPLSYDGVVVKIHWSVRVRAFLRTEPRRRSLIEEAPFRLLSRRVAGDGIQRLVFTVIPVRPFAWVMAVVFLGLGALTLRDRNKQDDADDSPTEAE